MTTPYPIRCVAPVANFCGEGATWSPSENAIYWTDICRFVVYRMTVSDGAVRTWLFDQPCVALALTDRPGTMLLGLGSRLIFWEPETDTRTDHGFVLDNYPTVRLNEGRAGPGGEMWIGSMANNVGPDGEDGIVDGFQGELFRISADEAPQKFRSEIGISNTMCFSPDGRHLYFGDSNRNVVWRYDYDAATRNVTNEIVFFENYDRGKPDGSAIDSDGYLWNARFGGGCVVRVAPDGSIDKVVEMPVSNITTCQFGGADMTTLFVTTSTIFLEPHERLAGSLFAIDTDVTGAPAHHYILGD